MYATHSDSEVIRTITLSCRALPSFSTRLDSLEHRLLQRSPLHGAIAPASYISYWLSYSEILPLVVLAACWRNISKGDGLNRGYIWNNVILK